MTRKGVSTARAAGVFGAAALVTLVAGALLEESGSQAADSVGLSGVLFGATVLAAATSLPELSTGLTAVRSGDYQLAFGKLTLRVDGRLHHIGVGRAHARTPILMLIQELHVRIINAATGELLRDLTIDPSRDYQPSG